MNRRAVFYLVLVFVLGVSFGGVGTYLAEEWKVVEWHGSARHHGPSLVDRMSRELVLTPEQQSQLQSILEETGKQYRQVRETARQRIREILTIEQRPKFEELLRQIDAERRQRRERGLSKSAPKETR